MTSIHDPERTCTELSEQYQRNKKGIFLDMGKETRTIYPVDKNRLNSTFPEC